MTVGLATLLGALGTVGLLAIGWVVGVGRGLYGCSLCSVVPGWVVLGCGVFLVWVGLGNPRPSQQCPNILLSEPEN